MFIRLFIVSLILVAIIFLALGVKLWFDPKSEFTVHSCALEDGSLDENGACAKCQIKDLVNCPEKEKQGINNMKIGKNETN